MRVSNNKNIETMSKAPRYRRPLIEALEPRLLFSATADIAVFDDGNSDVQYLTQAAQEIDLVSIYRPDNALDIQALIEPDTDHKAPEVSTLVFVDTAVENYQTLVKDIQASLDNQSAQIIYLDSTKDGLVQISNYLAGTNGIAAVHIISHGVAGSVQLGSQVLNENTIAQYQQSLQGWKNSFSEDADILFYGCDVAASQNGMDLLRQISELTGADVAASNNLTGTGTNADWELEAQVGRIETASIFSANQSTEWKGVLADVVHLYSGVATHQQVIPVGGDIKQGVQLTSTQTIDRIQVMMANYGTSSSSIQMLVHQSSYNGTVVASSTVSTASIGNSLDWVNFDFSQTTLNAYYVYWVEFRTNDGADNLVSIGYINSNVIAGEFVVNNSGNSLQDMSIALVDVENRLPVIVNPILDQTTAEESWYSYTFPANTFSDVDGDPLTYTATLSNGNPLPSWLTFNAGARTLSGVPDDADVGTISIRITASDGKGGSVSDTFDLTVTNVNDIPFLTTPIPNQFATEDTFYSYTFPSTTFGDRDAGTIFTYTAELAGGGNLPSWLSFDSAMRTFSGTPVNADVGTISVRLIANDGAGGVVSDTFDLVVINTNDDPIVANPIPNQIATENALFNYTFPINTFNDPDIGDTLVYTAALAGGGALPGWLMFDAATRTFNGVPSNGDVGTISIRVTADDGDNSVSSVFDLVVQNVGSSNVVYETSGPSTDTQVVMAGGHFFQSFSHDSIGATYTIDSIVLQVMKDPAAVAQTITVTLLSGAHNGTELGSATLSSADIGSTLAWKAFDFTDTVLAKNQLYFIRIESSGTDGHVKVAIHNADVYPNGSYYSGIGIEDSTRDVAFQVSSGDNIDPAIVNPIPNQTATEDLPFNFQFSTNTFNDADVGDSLVYSATMADGSALPSWLSFNAATRTFSGIPGNADVGIISIKVIADDGNGGTPASDIFDLVIINTNDAPTVANPIPNQIAIEDSAFNFTFATNTFFDQDVGDTLSYTAQLSDGSALPSWLNFDVNTRTFSGIPTNANVGTLLVEVTASDGLGGAVTDTFTITVINTNDAPTIANAIPDQYATEGAAFNFQFDINTFVDQDIGDTLTYSTQLAGGGALPAWLSFNAATRTFSGIPANNDVGSFTVRVIANDGNGGSVSDTFIINVSNVNDAPEINIALNDYYTDEQTILNLHGTGITISDVDSNTVTVIFAAPGPDSQLSANAGSTGINILSGNHSSSLVITGTLNQINNFLTGNNGSSLTYLLASDSPPASVILTITASDGSLTTTDTTTIHIAAINDSPVVSNPISDQTATQGTPFNFQFSANTFTDVDVGDTLTYTAQLFGSGALPSWLTFNAATRTFSGTPTNDDVGVINLQVTASDSNGGSVSLGFSLTVINVNDAPTVDAPVVNPVAYEDSQFTLSFPLTMFNDVDAGDSLTYSALLSNGQALPSWLQFDATTLTFNGTPTNNDVGNISIQLTASDGQASVSFQFTLRVEAVNDAPVAIPPATINNLEDAPGDQIDLFTIFSDEETPVNQLIYSVVSNSNQELVTGATIDIQTGTLTFVYGANQFGSSDLIIRAQDPQGAFVDVPLRINIAPVNDAPVTTGIADIQVDAGAAPRQINLQSVFSDIEDGTSLRYSLIANTNSAVIPNIEWNQTSGLMVITFASATGGESFITLRAQDSEGEWVETRFKVTVVAPSPIPSTPEPPVTPPLTPEQPEVPVAPPVSPPVLPPIETPAMPPVIPPSNVDGNSGNTTDISNNFPGDDINTPQPANFLVDPNNLDTAFNSPNDKSSRDYERMEAAISAQNVPVTLLTASAPLSGLINTDAGFAPWEAEEFDNEVRRIREQMDVAMEQEQDRRAVVAGITFSVTTGILIWSLRASSLLLTLMSILPLWRGLDPLPILDEVNKRKKELEQQRKDRMREDKSSKEVGYLFDHAQQKQSGR